MSSPVALIALRGGVREGGLAGGPAWLRLSRLQRSPWPAPGSRQPQLFAPCGLLVLESQFAPSVTLGDDGVCRWQQHGGERVDVVVLESPLAAN